MDAGSIALFGLAATSDSNGATQLFAYSGLGTFALGGPIVHAAHGRWGIAGADLGLRVGGVMAGFLIGGMVGAASSPPCVVDDGASGSGGFCALNGEAEGAFIGTMVGAVAAAAIDASVLARRKVRISDDDARTSAFTWTPTITPGRSGASASVVGTF